MKTGLALSGGAVRGMAHIGVLKYLEERNINIDVIAGTSAGSLIGALHAAGMSANEIEKIALNINWKTIMKNIPTVSLPKKGLVNIKILEKLLNEHLGGLHFNQLKKPLIVVAVDLINSRVVHIKSGEVTSAILASCAIPGIFTPIERDGLTLIDGGVLQNIPTEPLYEENVERIIAVDLNARSVSVDNPKNIFEILYKSLYLMATEKEKDDKRLASFVIEPKLDTIDLWELDKTRELIELGYKEAEKTLANVKIEKTLWQKLRTSISANENKR